MRINRCGSLEPHALFITAAVFAALAAFAFAAIKTSTYSSGNLARAINDDSTFTRTIHVPNRGRVKDVNVAIRLNHTDTADLVLALISPHAKYVTLTNRSSTDGGDNLGSGPNNCSGKPTTFDDSGALLSSGASPYAGHFQPVTNLSDMNGQRTRGGWQLVVIDAAGGDTGTLGCWKLKIKRKT